LAGCFLFFAIWNTITVRQGKQGARGQCGLKKEANKHHALMAHLFIYLNFTIVAGTTQKLTRTFYSQSLLTQQLWIKFGEVVLCGENNAEATKGTRAGYAGRH
jgi:hypothetical protein